MTTAGSEADDASLLPDVGLKPPIGVAGLGDSAFDFVDVVLTREINKDGLEVHVLFLALLLELSSCKDHVCCASTSTKATDSQDEAIKRLRQVPINQNIDAPPTFKETHNAINQLSSGKAPGIDVIPAEVYKSGDPAFTQKLVDITRGYGGSRSRSRTHQFFTIW
ncbi:hypothetical protein ACROYT_G028086 [Oculina patagonica]